MYQLSNYEFNKILDFSEQINANIKDYRESVLALLLEMYNFKHATFLICDQNSHLVDPIGINMSDTLLRNYNQYYHKTDFFADSKNLRHKIITISDLMSYREYERTEYYNDFLKKEDLYYQIAMPLKVNNKLLGGIGIFREKRYGNFTGKEVSVLNFISKTIGSGLNNSQKNLNIVSENELLKSTITNMPIGFLSLDKNLNIKNYNNTTLEICEDIFKCNNTEVVKSFIELLNPNISNPLNETKYSMLNVQGYTVCIKPVFYPNNTYYNVYIYQDCKPEDKLKQLKHVYKITKREQQVLELVYQGLSNKQIANSLIISQHTVKTHIENIYKKLNINSRSQIAKLVK